MAANVLHQPVSIARESYPGYSLVKTNRNNYTTPVVECSVVDSMLLKVSEFESLPANWDGHDAMPISGKVVFNANMFLKKLPGYYSDKLNIEDITPTPYGTIVMDWYNDAEELISIEIGKTKVGYFTEFHDSNNPFSEGIEFKSTSIPEELISLLRRLYPSA